MARDDSVVGQGSGKGVDRGEDQEVRVVNTGDRLNVGVGRWRKLVTCGFLAWGTDWI